MNAQEFITYTGLFFSVLAFANFGVFLYILHYKEWEEGWKWWIMNICLLLFLLFGCGGIMCFLTYWIIELAL